MSLRVEMSIDQTSLARTLRALRSLPEKVQRRSLRAAVTQATIPYGKAIRREAPRETGMLRRNIGRKVIAYPRKKLVIGLAGPKNLKDSATGRNPAHYAHLVEFGTRPHTLPLMVLTLPSGRQIVRQNVQHPGAKANPFMARASQIAKEAAIQRFASRLKSDVAIIAAELRTSA